MLLTCFDRFHDCEFEVEICIKHAVWWHIRHINNVCILFLDSFCYLVAISMLGWFSCACCTEPLEMHFTSGYPVKCPLILFLGFFWLSDDILDLIVILMWLGLPESHLTGMSTNTACTARIQRCTAGKYWNPAITHYVRVMRGFPRDYDT